MWETAGLWQRKRYLFHLKRECFLLAGCQHLVIDVNAGAVTRLSLTGNLPLVKPKNGFMILEKRCYIEDSLNLNKIFVRLT